MSISIHIDAFAEDVLYNFFERGFGMITVYVGSDLVLSSSCCRSEFRSRLLRCNVKTTRRCDRSIYNL